MRKIITAALASMLLATSAVGTVANAQYRERHGDRDRFVSDYCNSHRWDRDCRDWRDNRHRWNDSRYDRWYRDHRREFGPADAAAAIFGLAAGAIGAAAANGGHVARCEDAYRSYDPRTDQYLGYDGRYHYCRL